MVTVGYMAQNKGEVDALNIALIGQVLAEAGRRRWPVTELARRSGIPHDSLKRYVSGSRPLNIAHLAKLADAFGVSAHDLVAAAEVARDAFVARVASHPDADMLAQLTPEQQAEILAAEDDAPNGGDAPSDGRKATGT